MKKQHYHPTWNDAYSFEDLHEYTAYHVIVKIADKSFRLFPHSRDAFYYWQKLRENLLKHGCRLVEYMTMNSHVHFLTVTQEGLLPLMKAVAATNTSYAMHLRYAAKRKKISDADQGLIDQLRETPDMRIFQKHVCYIPINGYRHLLIELRYIKRNPENAGSSTGDKYISSRQEYNRNYFEFIDKETISGIARMFSRTPHELHAELMVADESWWPRLDMLVPEDISDEQRIFKISEARFPLRTFKLAEGAHGEDSE